MVDVVLRLGGMEAATGKCERAGPLDRSKKPALDCREACTSVAEFRAQWPETSWSTR